MSDEIAFMGKWNTGGAPGSNSWLLQIGHSTAGNAPRFVYEVGNNKEAILANQQLQLNQWYHVVARRTGTLLEILMNGEVWAAQDIGTIAFNNVDIPLHIGRLGVDGYNLNASVDDIRFFKRSLTASEINVWSSGATAAPNTYTPAALAGNNHYDYGFRIYNPRIAKFLSVDPLTKSYPMLTPYQFASNTPIWAIDLDGLEALYFHLEGRLSIPMIGPYGVTGSSAYGLAFDLQGNVAGYQAYSLGGQVGAVASVGIGVGFNPLVDDVYGLQGYGFNIGLSAAPELVGPGFGVEGNLTIPSQEGEFKFKNVPKFLQEVIDQEGDFGGGLTVSFGPTIGASVYAEGAYTDFFGSFNIFEESEKLKPILEELYNKLDDDFRESVGLDDFIKQTEEFIRSNLRSDETNEGKES